MRRPMPEVGFCATKRNWSPQPDYPVAGGPPTGCLRRCFLPSYHVFFSCLGPSILLCRSQWPRGIRRRSAATRLLRL